MDQNFKRGQVKSPVLRLFDGQESASSVVAAAAAPQRGAMISYSMNREDVLLERVFADQPTGFYVDVGANSPERYSNTKHFYDKGWRGINIEPSRAFEELARQRSRDINLRLVLSDHVGTIPFHECVDTSLSSVQQRELPAGLAAPLPQEVPVQTLANILAGFADQPIDFMSIDVEGHERQVLAGNDWQRCRPRVLLIEATGLLSHAAVHEAWEAIVLQAGYLFAYFDGINRYYVRREDAGLLAHFAYPPTSLEYVPAEVVKLRQQLDEHDDYQPVRQGPLHIWYDVTTPMLYPANKTGIPRVVSKTLEALQELVHAKTRLCVYDYQRQCFVKVTHKPSRLGRLQARAGALLGTLLRPVRRLGQLAKKTTRWCSSRIRRRVHYWLATKPRLRRVGRPIAASLRRLLRVVVRVIAFPRLVMGWLHELQLGIRSPYHPRIIARPMLFPFCLLCNHWLKQLPAAAPLRQLRQRRQLRQWFWLNSKNGQWVRAKKQPLLLSSKDVVVQLGWHPHQQGIAAAKQKLGFRYVSIVHDLIPVKLPHFVGQGFPEQFAAATAEQLRVSDLILANSECTLRDLRDFAREERVVMPPADVLRFGSEVRFIPGQAAGAPVPGLRRGEPFVLTVSTMDPRKNHRSLYLVWRQLVQEFGQRTPKLVIVGYPGHQLLHEMLLDPLVKDKILHRHPIDDVQLDWLYQHCLFTAYPSYYEGWGLPVSESLWYGKLCVASNSSSIPEIGGDLVDYHDPYDLAACHARIRQALDAQYRARRENEIKARYRPTTWVDCAEALCRAIQGHMEAPHAPVLLQYPVRPAMPPLRKAG